VVFNLAVVSQVLPERHGVLVAYRNGVEHHANVGSDDALSFVRVLERRAHGYGGATISLPEVGELGLVLDVDPGTSIWIGSLPWEKANQMDPRPGLAGWRHASGVQVIVLEDGSTQFWHPSGVGLTVSGDGVPVDEIAGTIPMDQLKSADATFAAHVLLSHPSGFSLHIDPAGALEIDSPDAVTVLVGTDLVAEVDGTATLHVVGDVVVTGDANVTATIKGDLQATVDGNATLKAAKIVLDGPVECTGTFKATGAAEFGDTLSTTGDATIAGKSFVGHTHTSAASGSPTSPPV